MTHFALARKYRPTRFSELIAQGHVAAGLAGAVEKNRVAHAYLLTGPRGVGKTTAARILAMALNCERRGTASDREARSEPCGECESCRRIWSGGTSLDVVEIDAASNRGVDDARELRERAMYAASSEGRFKVYIIDEAHMLTREAWNALLKVLEEPPPQVVFVFATTEPQKIANTAAPVLSRVQRFDFRRIGPRLIADRLQEVVEAEGLEFEREALELISRVAAGGMRDALSILDQVLAFGENAVDTASVRDALGLIREDLYGDMLEMVAGRRAGEVFGFVEQLTDAGADLGEFMNGAGEILRALLMRKLGSEDQQLSDGLTRVVESHLDAFSEGDLLRMLQMLTAAETGIRRAANTRLQVELLLVQWCLLDSTVKIEDLLQAVAGSPDPSGNAPPAKATPRSVSPKKKRGAGRKLEDSKVTRRQSGDAPLDSDEPLSLNDLSENWAEISAEVTKSRRMLGQALSQGKPVEVNGRTVVVQMPDATVLGEGLAKSGPPLSDAIQAITGKPGPWTFEAAEHESQPEDDRRLNPDRDRRERLEAYRAKDSTLDAAADALDLELLD